MLIILCKSIERLVLWPARLLIMSLARIPRNGGGTRLVALMFTPVRAWAKVRAPVVQNWGAAHDSPSFWGGKGRMSVSAAHSFALHSEIACWTGGFVGNGPVGH